MITLDQSEEDYHSLILRDQNITLLPFEEICPLESVLIVKYLCIFAQFSPIFVLFVIQKYHLAEIG